MIARVRKAISDLSDAFWALPAAIVLGLVALALGLVELDRGGLVSKTMLNSPFLYNGGGTGARTLLGAVASSTIGVAGTVFSITIAALSLAAGQMGPRLLRNFTRDRGNQFTLGIFVGTFSYALMVLRTVRTKNEGEFIPHVSLSVAILLAFVCVGTLVYFVGHMASRINVDRVIDLVGTEVRGAIKRLMHDEKPAKTAPPSAFWADAVPVADARRGFLQHMDSDGLADWAAAHEVVIRLLVRPGDYVFPGAPIALVKPFAEGVEGAIRDATALGAQRVSSEDLEFAVRQLVEVAVRALSPGINDPHTAMSVLERLAAALCDVASLHLQSGVYERGGRSVLVVPDIDYAGLVDAMFHMIRQNAAGSAAVLIRLLEVLTAVISVEHDAERRKALQRHADLVLTDAERDVKNAMDVHDVRSRHQRFARMRDGGPVGAIGVSADSASAGPVP